MRNIFDRQARTAANNSYIQTLQAKTYTRNLTVKRDFRADVFSRRMALNNSYSEVKQMSVKQGSFGNKEHTTEMRHNLFQSVSNSWLFDAAHARWLSITPFFRTVVTN